MSLVVTRTTYESGSDKKTVTVDVYGENPDGSPINGEVNNPGLLQQKPPDTFIPKTLKDLYDSTLGQKEDPYGKASEALKKIIKDPTELGKSLSKDMAEHVFKTIGYPGTVEGLLTPIKVPKNKRELLANLGEKNQFFKIFVKDPDSESPELNLGFDVNAGLAVDGEYEADAAYYNRVNALSHVLDENTTDAQLVSVYNPTPRMGLMRGYIDEAMDLRIPNGVDIILDSFEDPEEKRALKVLCTMNAAIRSDILFIKKQLEDPDIGAGPIMSLTPNIINLILTNYRLLGTQPTAEEAKFLIDILDMLHDQWLTYRRGSKDILDVSALNKASEDAIKTLLKDKRTELVAILSKNSYASNPVEYTFDMRPYTPYRTLSQ